MQHSCVALTTWPACDQGHVGLPGPSPSCEALPRTRGACGCMHAHISKGPLDTVCIFFVQMQPTNSISIRHIGCMLSLIEYLNGSGLRSLPPQLLAHALLRLMTKMI